MIKKNQKFLTIINVLSDFFAIVMAYVLSIFIWLNFMGTLGANIAEEATLVITYSLLCVFLYKLFGLYDSYRFKKIHAEVLEVLKSTSVSTLIFGLLLYVLRLSEFSRGVLVLSYVLTICIVGLKRVLLRKILRRYRKIGYNQKHVIVIGAGNLAKRYVENIKKNPQFGFYIDGYVSDDESSSLGEKLGNYNDLNDILEASKVDEIVIAFDAKEVERIDATIDVCEKYGCKIYIIPFYNDYIPTVPAVDVIEDIKLINMRTIPLDSDFCALQKRALDIVLSLMLIVLTSPFMIVAAIGTFISSPGPVIFKQERVGRDKKVFTMYKFRSMRITGTEKTGWSTREDSRKTKFGSFIRKTSIDELPQFFNVLKGDMSLVGPRPEVVYYVERFKEEIPLYMVKHQVRPGITGWAQIHGFRGDTSIEERIKHDIWYIENWSIFLDIKIIFLTVFKGKIINDEKIVKNNEQDSITNSDRTA